MPGSHENYWILHPSATYDEVVSAETAFEAALKNPNDPARVYDFTKYVDDDGESYAALVKWELAAGGLKNMLNNQNQFTLLQLLGQDWFNCEIKEYGNIVGTRDGYTPGWNFSYDMEGGTVCHPYFRENLNSLIASNPRSMLLRKLFSDDDHPGNEPRSSLIDIAQKMNPTEAESCTVTVEPTATGNGVCHYGKGKVMNFDFEF